MRVEAKGDAALLSVTDQGEGIESGVMEHLFEPYFTTREGSGGTGLGLATVAAIAHLYGGSVSVSTKLGAGSTFLVRLPLATP